jgi:hypothetical protein
MVAALENNPLAEYGSAPFKGGGRSVAYLLQTSCPFEGAALRSDWALSVRGCFPMHKDAGLI